MTIPVGDSRNECRLYRADGEPIRLGGIYTGNPAFLVCAGPSTREQDLSLLQARGILTMAVNNAAVTCRPNLWIAGDSPLKWLHQVLQDPAVLKFIPRKHFEQCYRVTHSDRYHDEPIGLSLPMIFGYRRNSRFAADRFLTEDTFNWGCGAGLADANGEQGFRSIMFVALKMLFYLGVRQVYLLGCDFHVDADRPYAFDETLPPAMVKHNNRNFEITSARLALLRPHFEEHGFYVTNCTPGSKLSAFPFEDYEDVVSRASMLCAGSLVTEKRYQNG